MNQKIWSKRLFFIWILCIFLAATLSAISIESFDVSGGVIWIGNTGDNTAPSPITSTLAVSIPIRFSPVVLIVPELGYFGGTYGIENDRTVPVEIEFKDSVFVASFLASPRVVFAFNLSPSLILGASVGPTVVIRVPTVAWGEGETQREEIVAYQYASARFFYPEVGLLFDWAIPLNVDIPSDLDQGEGEDSSTNQSRVHLAVNVRGYLPVFHLWDGENLPFHDQLMVSGSAVLRFFLGP